MEILVNAIYIISMLIGLVIFIGINKIGGEN